jgi:hypothetical protein
MTTEWAAAAAQTFVPAESRSGRASTVAAKLLPAVIALGLVALPAQAGTSKYDWSKMSESQKKKIRAEARKYCQKKYGGAGNSIARVELLPGGKIKCWVYG